MEYDREENGTGRWIASTILAAAGMLFFLLLAVTSFRRQVLPDIGPLLELDYVTIEEPRKAPPVEPPRVKPRENKKEEVPKSQPDPLPEELSPLPKVIETVPVQTETADLPARPSEPTPVPAAPKYQRIESPAELDNTGFEPIFNPKPEYPRVALEARITGYVDVDLNINGNGRIQSFTIVTIKGHPSFGDALTKVLPRWRFPPPRIGGRKTSVRYIYRINFVLN
jgi:periplasmic protein TonB